MSAPRFIPGLTLGRLFYQEAARAIIESVVPADGYSAALIGSGSEVLGCDSPRSADHNWGPRFQVFLPESSAESLGAALNDALEKRLPAVFRGYAVGFAEPDPLDGGTRVPLPRDERPVRHLIEITGIREYFRRSIGADVTAELAVADWLSFPEQRLLELTSGEVFHDPRGELEACRRKLAYHPRDVWLYRMACQWLKIFQQEAFPGRCEEAGDRVGMRITAGRIVRDFMRLCFLQERRYAPYEKWLGTAFRKLSCAPAAEDHVEGALEAENYAVVEDHLAALYGIAARAHNSLGLTGPMDTSVRDFFSRPYKVIRGERFAHALFAAISDEQLRGLPMRIGAVDQFVDSTDFIENVEMTRKSRALYS